MENIEGEGREEYCGLGIERVENIRSVLKKRVDKSRHYRVSQHQEYK